jgi:glycosyltransferase involved in cell wall biosynthesis
MYVPCYLDGNDGVINLAYYDALLGVDLTVFASYYEPWGYTPLESIAFSVPTVTSNKSGFGQWIESEFKSGLMDSGVEVVERTDSNYDTASLDIAKCVAQYAAYTSKEECKAGKAANDTASAAEWQNFICYYRKAFECADNAAAKRLNK